MSLTWRYTLRDGDQIYKEGDCLSTDTKPTNDTTLKNGSKLIELDTATVYMYDKDNTRWLPWGDNSRVITAAVNAWLAAHPEATTTVQDGAISNAKLDNNLKSVVTAVGQLEAGSLSALNANNGDVPVAKGDGTWEWSAKGYVTPEMYGAVGDGTTDDTTALAAMFASGVGEYYLTGTYAITAAVNASGHIYGTGTIKSRNKARMAALFNVAGNIRIEGITLDCECDTAYESADYGTSYNVAINTENNAYDVIVDHANFINGYNIFIYVHLVSGKLKITNSRFVADGTLNKYTGYMLFLLSISGTDPIDISHNTFIGNDDSVENFAGVFMSGISTRKVIDIGHNFFYGVGRDKTGGHQSHCIDAYWDVSHLFVHDNVMQNNSYCCLRFHGGTDCVIQNNVFGEATAVVGDACILIQDDNSSTGASHMGVSDVQIMNNLFKTTNKYSSAIQLTSASSGSAGLINNVSITGNTINATYTYAIMMDGSVSNINVCQNDIYGLSAAIYLVHGSVQFQTTRPIKIENNTITAGGGTCIYSQSSLGNPLVIIAQNAMNGYIGGINLYSGTYVSARNNAIDVTRNGESYGIKNVNEAGCNVINMVDSTSPISGVTTSYGNYVNGVLAT